MATRNYLNDLISGSELASEARARAKEKEYAFAASSNPEELDVQIRSLELRGFSSDKGPREGERRKRFSKDVASDVKLENSVWTMLFNLGFTHLNKDRQFYFSNSDSDTHRQVDIVAKDDDTLIFVECTQRVEEGKKSLIHLIDKVINLKRDVDQNVAKFLPGAQGLKIKFMIATENVEWGDADRRRAREADIGILLKEDRAYFAKLHSLVGGNARYQFLARYFAKRTIPSLEVKVPATKHTIGDRTYYHFCCSPYDLLKICTISHKARTSDNDTNPYQRMVTPNRLKSIGNFIKKGGVFPTNIVANHRGNELEFEERQGGASAFGILKLPSKFASIYVIDGQHRLYGFAFAKGAFQHDKSMVSVLLYEGLAPHEEVVEFLNINTKQVKIRTDLALEILADTPLVGENAKETLDNIPIHIVRLMEERQDSPFRGELKSVVSADDDAKLTRTSLIEGIKKGKFLGTTSSKKGKVKFSAGPFATEGELEPSETVEKAYAVLAGYFTKVARTAGEHWALTEGEGSFLHTNNGIRTLLFALSRIADFEASRGARFDRMSAVKILEVIGGYADEIGLMFRRMPSSSADIMRRRAGLSGIGDNADEIELHLYAKTDYASENAKRLHENRDVEGTKDAARLVGSIVDAVKTIVINRVQERFDNPGSSWWFEGVPDKVRKECDQLIDRSNGAKSRVEVITLSQLSSIVRYSGNWAPSRKALSLEEAKGTIEDRLGWLDFVLGIEKKLNQPGTVLHFSDSERLRNILQALDSTVNDEGLALEESSNSDAAAGRSNGSGDPSAHSMPAAYPQ